MCNFVESSKYFESLDPVKFEQIYQNHKQEAESNKCCLHILTEVIAGVAIGIFGVAAPLAAATVCAMIANPFIALPVLLVAVIATFFLIAACLPRQDVSPDFSTIKDYDLLNPEFKAFVKNRSQTTDEVRFHIDSKYTHFQFRAKQWEEKLAACQEKLNNHATEELVLEKMTHQGQLERLSHEILGCSYKEAGDIDALLEKECNDLKWASIIERCVQVALFIFAALGMSTVLTGGLLAVLVCPSTLLFAVVLLATMLATLGTTIAFMAVGEGYGQIADQADKTRTLLQDPEYKTYLKEHAKSSFDAVAKMRDAAFTHQFRMAKPRAELEALYQKSPQFNEMADEKYKIFQKLWQVA